MSDTTPNISSDYHSIPATWPADLKLQSLTLKNQSVRFEPISAADCPALAHVIVEHFIPDEPLIRAAGAGAALLSAKQNPQSAESVDFLRQSHAFVNSFFLAPAIASRPHVSFKVVSTSATQMALEQQVIIGMALAHVDYIDPLGNYNHSVYAIIQAMYNVLQLVNSG